MKENKNKHKAQWICEDQVSDTGPLGLLFNNKMRYIYIYVCLCVCPVGLILIKISFKN